MYAEVFMKKYMILNISKYIIYKLGRAHELIRMYLLGKSIAHVMPILEPQHFLLLSVIAYAKINSDKKIAFITLTNEKNA